MRAPPPPPPQDISARANQDHWLQVVAVEQVVARLMRQRRRRRRPLRQPNQHIADQVRWLRLRPRRRRRRQRQQQNKLNNHVHAGLGPTGRRGAQVSCGGANDETIPRASSQGIAVRAPITFVSLSLSRARTHLAERARKRASKLNS